MVDDEDAIGKRLHRFHHVLDHQNRDPRAGDGPDQLDHLGPLGRVQAAERFVEQEEMRTHGERGSEHQSFAGQHRQPAGQRALAVGQPAQHERVQRMLLSFGLEPQRRVLGLPTEGPAHEHVG